MAADAEGVAAPAAEAGGKAPPDAPSEEPTVAPELSGPIEEEGQQPVVERPSLELFAGLKSILESPDSTADELLETLRKADAVTVDKKLLSQTKMGMTVNKLHKHDDPRVAALADHIVARWKAALRAGPKHDRPPAPSSTPPEQPTAESTESPVAGRKRPQPDDSKFMGPFAREEKRNKCREFLFKAFLDGAGDGQRDHVDTQNLSRLIADMETALHNHHIERNNNPGEYNSQMRAIKANLADKKNPEFNARLYLGAISAEYVATMPSTEMASDAKKRERQKAKKDALEACQSDWNLRNVKRARGQFPCGKCKSDNTTYFQMQTRSSDEPMTTYVNCLNCGHRWKF